MWVLGDNQRPRLLAWSYKVDVPAERGTVCVRDDPEPRVLRQPQASLPQHDAISLYVNPRYAIACKKEEAENGVSRSGTVI